jgi:hypothetical protein
MKHLTENELTLLYFGEEDGESDSSARRHLEACAQCAQEYRDLAQFLNVVRNAPTPEQGREFEQRLWAMIAPQVREHLGRPRARFRYWMLAPVFAGLLGLAFLAGMYTQHEVTKGAGPISAKARERVLLIAMGDHFDRSQIVLAELVNAPEGQPLNISSEQQLAGDLVSQNRILRQTAVRRGDAANAAVLDELERVLLDIAHAPAEIPPEQLEDLQRRIEAQGLLFKVRVISSNVREKGMKL